MKLRLSALLVAVIVSVTVRGQSHESDLMYEQGVELYSKGLYTEAIPFFQKADSLDYAQLEEGSYRAEYALWWLASCYYKLGDTDTARSLYPHYYMYAPVDRRLTVESDALFMLSDEYLYEGDLSSAIECLDKGAAIEKSVLGPRSLYYANTIANKAQILIDSGCYDDVESLVGEVLGIYKELSDGYGIGNCYIMLGDKAGYNEDCDLAISYYETACDTFAHYGYKTETADPLLHIAGCKNELSLYDEALEICGAAMSVVEADTAIQEGDYAYALLYSNMAVSEYFLDIYDKSFGHSCLADSIFKENGDIQSHEYFSNGMYMTLSACSRGTGECSVIIKELYDNCRCVETDDPYYGLMMRDIQQLYYSHNPDSIPTAKLVTLQRQLADDYKQTYGEKSSYYLEELSDLLSTYGKGDYIIYHIPEYKELMAEISGLVESVEDFPMARKVNIYKHISQGEDLVYGDVDKAISTIKKALAMLEEAGLDSCYVYCDLLNTMAGYYNGKADYYNAYVYYTAARGIYEALGICQNEKYSDVLKNIAVYYLNVGDMSKAEDCYEKANGILSDLGLIDDSHNDIRDLFCLASFGKREEAVRWLDEYQTAMESLPNEGGVSYTKLIYNFTRMIENEENASQDVEELFNLLCGKLPEVDVIGFNQVGYYINAGNDEAAIAKALELVEKMEKRSYINLQIISEIYASLSALYLKRGNNNEAVECAWKAMQSASQHISDNFRTMAYNERANFWNKYYEWFTVKLPNMAYRLDEERMNGILYNSVLMSKGLLLNSEIELKRLIAETEDTTVISLYEDLQILYTQRQKLAKEPDVYAHLSSEIDSKEKVLINTIKEYGDYTKNLTLTWNDICECLTSDEAAVEFVVCPFNEDSVMYSALVLRPGQKPHFVKLFSERELLSIPSDSLYISSSLSQLVWEPLQEELSGVKSVYFSPQGLLYSTAIEYAPTNNGQLISDTYNLYRLSSTREIVMEHKSKLKTAAVLYGGLNYNADMASVAAAPKRRVNSDTSIPRASVEYVRGALSGVMDLKYTLAEVLQIGDMYKSAGENCYTYTGNEGSEESFKDLSGAGMTLIHIATHGYYYTEKQHDSKSIPALHTPVMTSEDKALTRSGLLFAGANTALRHGAIPSDRDDGILTAQEISTLDLRGLDLVVLSACQTALGEMTGDGVFGLQRGFKKAGANALLMSLWNVDDKATQLLMTTFYRNYIKLSMNGVEDAKRVALRNAQDELRNIEGGKYNSPELWAAFILLDGL